MVFRLRSLYIFIFIFIFIPRSRCPSLRRVAEAEGVPCRHVPVGAEDREAQRGLLCRS